MIWIAIGGALLFLVLGALRAFAGASVGQVRTALAALAAAVAALLLGLVLLTGRGASLLWALPVFGPLAWRWWRARQLAGRFAGPAAAPDTVETATLVMTLDPVAGTVSGRVRRGPWAGEDLHALDLDALLALRRDCEAADPDSAPLVEDWLDRAHPGWRGNGDGPAPAGPMTRADALAVLGLADAADEAEIRAAYTRLMRAAHPDMGGSDWLAARLNEARDALLRP